MKKESNHSKSTGEFIMELISTLDFEAFYAKNLGHLHALTLPEYLNELCERKGVLSHELVNSVDIDRVFGYKIFSGERRPSRDYILKLALGLELTVEETQRLLAISGNSQLYPRVPRDAAIFYCLYHNLGYRDTQEKLYDWGIKPLGDK